MWSRVMIGKRINLEEKWCIFVKLRRKPSSIYLLSAQLQKLFGQFSLAY